MIFGLVTLVNGQKVSINYSIIDSAVIEIGGNGGFTKDEALRHFGQKSQFILDDDDTTHCGGATTFRKSILYNCTGEVILPHTIYKAKYEVPVQPKGYRTFRLCDLTGELWANPIVQEVSPDEIVARILVLTCGHDGFLPKNTNGYEGIFIGFCNNHIVNIFWKKCNDGVYRWKIQCDNACSVVPAKEPVLL